jgi:predicted dinucleotide-binding enzyme
MARIAVIGAGSVGRALAGGLRAAGHDVTFGVRDPADPRHAAIGAVATTADATRGAEVVILAVPANAVPTLVPALGFGAGQVVLDATNAVRDPVPGGFATMGELVGSLLPDGVALAKAFDTIGAEHLGDGRITDSGLFLPVAGDPAAVDIAVALAGDLGFAVAPLGGRERFAMVEDHARLWIHLAFGCGWGRGFGFAVVRP